MISDVPSVTERAGEFSGYRSAIRVIQSVVGSEAYGRLYSFGS